jgi:hypothetical protein
MQVPDSQRWQASFASPNSCDVTKKREEQDVQRLDSNMEKHCAQWMKFPNCEDYCNKRIKPSELEGSSLESARKDCQSGCEDARVFCEYQNFIKSLRR